MSQTATLAFPATFSHIGSPPQAWVANSCRIPAAASISPASLLPDCSITGSKPASSVDDLPKKVAAPDTSYNNINCGSERVPAGHGESQERPRSRPERHAAEHIAAPRANRLQCFPGGRAGSATDAYGFHNAFVMFNASWTFAWRRAGTHACVPDADRLVCHEWGMQ